MSNNAAELWTLWYALVDIAGWMDVNDPFSKRLLIKGDSQIALKWANLAAGNPVNGKHTPHPKSSEEMLAAIYQLKFVLPKFQSVQTHWQPRQKSVEAFGH